MKSSEMLRVALENVPGNWHQGNMFGDEGDSACGLGHVNRAALTSGSFMPRSEMNAAYESMAVVAGEQFPERAWNSQRHTFAAFNDHPDTTEDEVIAVMEKAAIQLEERGE